LDDLRKEVTNRDESRSCMGFYNFSHKLLTSAFLQLNPVARLSLINIKLRYIYSTNSDFFIIYNQSTGAGLERPSYSLQFKLTRDFTF
jgi:hypothetical protein